jgi:uncharacterized protein (TIGR02145 family)
VRQKNKKPRTMSQRLFFTLFLAFFSFYVFAQRPNMELTCTGIDSTSWHQLDSIKVMNRSQGADTIIYWPDTVLMIEYAVGIDDISGHAARFEVFQNYPNPVSDKTNISILVPDEDKVTIVVTDFSGRSILSSESVLNRGLHSFQLAPGTGTLSFLTAWWRNNSSSIKVLHPTKDNDDPASLKYSGFEPVEHRLKTSGQHRAFLFSLGDELLCIGYSGEMESGILSSPEESREYSFQFASNIPCLGTDSVEFGGQVYNTIQIYSQCWLKENLNVGIMIPSSQNMEDNGKIEKYCYDNEPDSCIKYGGLYQWWEMMQYTTQQGVQGICPPGWHIPTDEEWKVLEGSADSYYGIGDIIWDDYDSRGFDAGKNLKSMYGWNMSGNGTDLFGFTGLPGGVYNYLSNFSNVLNEGIWWTSTEYGNFPWTRSFRDYKSDVNRFSGWYIGFGLSVRCLKDE